MLLRFGSSPVWSFAVVLAWVECKIKYMRKKVVNPELFQSGGDEANAFFEKLMVPAVDVTSVNAKFKDLCALFAHAADYKQVGLTPSAAGMVQMRFMGESELVLVRVADLQHLCKGWGVQNATVSSLAESFKQISSTVMDEICKTTEVYHATANANEILWIPAGFFVAERATGTSGLHYGVRKSFFNPGEQAGKDLEAVVEAIEGASGETLKRILKLY
eukprot:6492760-Amphidinium_carterae.6